MVNKKMRREERLFNGFAFVCKSIVFLLKTFAFTHKIFVMEKYKVGGKTIFQCSSFL